MSRPEIVQNHVGGRWTEAQASGFVDVHNPALGAVIAATPLSSAADLDGAVGVAARAFPAWRDTPVVQRARAMRWFATLLEEQFDELARTVTTEHGKTIDESRGGVRRGIECVEAASAAPSLMMGYGRQLRRAQTLGAGALDRAADVPTARAVRSAAGCGESGQRRSRDRRGHLRSSRHSRGLVRRLDAGRASGLPARDKKVTITRWL